MSKKKTETPVPEEKTPATPPAEPNMALMLKDELDDVKGQLLQLTDFTLETRLTAVMSSHSLPLITTQFKRVIAEAYAVRNSLVDVEAELAEKHASCEDLLRERARISEKHKYLNTNFEAYLSRYRQTVELLAIEKGRTRQLELEMQSQKDLVAGVSEVMATLREMAQKKRLPADVIAELKTILGEVPKPTPVAPEEVASPGEEELD